MLAPIRPNPIMPSCISYPCLVATLLHDDRGGVDVPISHGSAADFVASTASIQRWPIPWG